MASGGYGAAAFILEARGDRASADAVLGVIEAWDAGGEWPRRWATPLAGSALARKGDFAAARRTLDKLLDSRPLYLGRELEARCTLIAEERAWDEVCDVVVEARRHAETAQLLALPLHADRLEGRALLAAGDADAALPLLERALGGFAGLSAAWEGALCELALGQALTAIGRSEDALAVLTRAAEVFERLRVPRELEEARALLGALAPAD
jgi:tetratricopeptide (TPR) repeat protein